MSYWFEWYPQESVIPISFFHYGPKNNSHTQRFSVMKVSVILLACMYNSDSILGAGYVAKAGANVKTARAGDSVLLSYQSCSSCKDCLEKHPAYCQQFAVSTCLQRSHFFPV